MTAGGGTGTLSLLALGGRGIMLTLSDASGAGWLGCIELALSPMVGFPLVAIVGFAPKLWVVQRREECEGTGAGGVVGGC